MGAKYSKISVINLCIIILILSCWGCYEDPLKDQNDEPLRSGQLTVEKAYDLFKEYAYNTGVSTRSIEAGSQKDNLDPGIVTPAWENAALSATRVNSFVNVPIVTTNHYQVKSPYNKDWVNVAQKLVVVQEDATQRYNIYLLNIIPEGQFAVEHRNGIADLCQGGQRSDDFSGLIVYTKMQGGLPVYVASYNGGELKKEVFLFDERFSFKENLDRINSLLSGYSLRTSNMLLTRASFSESGGSEEESGGGAGGSSGGGSGGSSGDGPGGGSGGSSEGNWQFHTEGDSFQQDGFTCWHSSDGKGNHYIVADLNGDGKPDTILDSDGKVPGGSGNPGGGIPGGDIKPETGGNSSSEGGGAVAGLKIDPTGMSKEIQEQIANVMRVLKGMGFSDKVLNKLSIRMGFPPVGMNACVTTSGSIMNILFGDTPFIMTLAKDSQTPADIYKLVVAHEFYHLFLYGITRDAGNMTNLYNIDPKLHFLINTDTSIAHHKYMGYDNARYEQFLSNAFPGEEEKFYKYGKWGGGATDADEFNHLSPEEREKIKDYLKKNNLWS